MPTIQSRFGPVELRRTNATIEWFNTVRRDLLNALDRFIETSMNSIVLEQIEGEEYTTTWSRRANGILIGTGLAGVLMFIFPSGALALGVANIVIQVGCQLWKMKKDYDMNSSKISEMRKIHEELSNKIRIYSDAEQAAFGELDNYANMGTSLGVTQMLEILDIIRDVERDHGQRFEEFKRFVGNVGRLSQEVIKAIRSRNGIKTEELLNGLIGLTPVAASMLGLAGFETDEATMAVLETGATAAIDGTAIDGGATAWSTLSPAILALNLLQIFFCGCFLYQNTRRLEDLNEARNSMRDKGKDRDEAIKKIAPDVFRMKEQLKDLKKSIEENWERE